MIQTMDVYNCRGISVSGRFSPEDGFLDSKQEVFFLFLVMAEVWDQITFFS